MMGVYEYVKPNIKRSAHNDLAVQVSITFIVFLQNYQMKYNTCKAVFFHSAFVTKAEILKSVRKGTFESKGPLH